MNKGSRTPICEDNLIVITIEEATHVSIEDNHFDFSYKLEPKNFQQCEQNLLKFIKQKKTRQRHNSCQHNQMNDVDSTGTKKWKR